jgi:NADPH:quinone reductase-like Zn-dependent oxidoreductase
MGILDNKHLGIEGAGVVLEVGSAVSDFQVGDRVLYFASQSSCLATRLRLSAQQCYKIPSQLSFSEAATMPCVYATVIHGVLDMGRLRKGESILIQSACGGIGLAAIQVCQNVLNAKVCPVSRSQSLYIGYFQADL